MFTKGGYIAYLIALFGTWQLCDSPILAMIVAFMCEFLYAFMEG